MQRGIKGSIVMLNLLRFRDVADYIANPELTPENPISGAEAFNRYIEYTLPFLRESGGHQDYLAGIGHRTAAIEDSRLLPMADLPIPN
ncbi:hypothetical protein [Cohnella cholangitidis]|nr:hypothetical protein [Cohnella cholangitidis]